MHFSVCTGGSLSLPVINDIMIWSHSWNDHLDPTKHILSSFKQVSLILDKRKYNFGFKSLDLLSHQISRLGLHTRKNKTNAIIVMKIPETIREL